MKSHKNRGRPPQVGIELLNKRQVVLFTKSDIKAIDGNRGNSPRPLFIRNIIRKAVQK